MLLILDQQAVHVMSVPVMEYAVLIIEVTALLILPVPVRYKPHILLRCLEILCPSLGTSMSLSQLGALVCYLDPGGMIFANSSHRYVEDLIL